MKHELTVGDLKRFWSKVKPDANSECWEWVGSYSSNKGKVGRHPVLSLSGANHKAYARRVMYFVCFGELPKMVSHTCGNPRCVSPNHLIPGKPSSAPAGRRFDSRPSDDWKRTDERLVGRVLSLHRQGLSGNQIATRLNVAQARVSYILQMAKLCHEGKLKLENRKRSSQTAELK